MSENDLDVVIREPNLEADVRDLKLKRRWTGMVKDADAAVENVQDFSSDNAICWAQNRIVNIEAELAASQAQIAEYERTEPLKVKERNELRKRVKDLENLNTHQVIAELEKMLSDEQEKNYRLLRM